MAAEKKTFEKCLADLEKTAEMLKNEDISLEEAMKCFEEGYKHYEERRGGRKNGHQTAEAFKKTCQVNNNR